MRILLFAAALAPFLTVTLPAAAAQLNLEECLRLALAHNNGVRSAASTAEAAAEEVIMKRSALLPSLSLKSYYTLRDRGDRLVIDADTFGSGFPPQRTTISTSDTTSYGIQVNLRQALFTGGALASEHRRAGHEANAAAAAHARQATVLRFQIRSSFNEGLIADSRIKAAEKGVMAAEERLRVSRARHEEGFLKRDELLRREAEVALARTRLIKSRNRSQRVLSRLKQLTGLNPEEELVLAGHPARLHFNGTLEDVLTGALDRREDIRSSSEQSAAAAAGINLARSGFLPQLFLEGNYLRQKETNLTRADVWSLTLQAEWSLFEWGRTSAAVRGAVARHSSRQSAEQELRRTARLEIEEAWHDVTELQSQVIAKEKLVKAEEATLAIVIDQWSAGETRLDEVTAGEAALWDAYDSYCQQAAALSNAFAALEAAISGDISRWVVQENLYTPEFASYEQRIHQPRRISSPAPPPLPTTENLAPPATANKTVSVEIAPAQHEHLSSSPAGSAASPSLPRANLAEPHPRATLAVPAAPGHKVRYRLQLGAFASRAKAREVAAELIPRLKRGRIQIATEGRFFKPLAGPYTSPQQAREAALEMGVSDYLIRSDHGAH